ncbi:MAG: TIR domain-containing protein [Bowdeniella nasicola]|nr:TIR domain-containing protein [Bowdeniella nasicola]
MTSAKLSEIRIFLSYNQHDREYAERFIEEFGGVWKSVIDRGVGACMAGIVVDGTADDYVTSHVRTTYLRNTTVTIVLIGGCTWSRKMVDWEIAATMQDTPSYQRGALLALTLPDHADADLPYRLEDNLGDDGYAIIRPYPTDVNELERYCAEAIAQMDNPPNNSRPLRAYNSYCEADQRRA